VSPEFRRLSDVGDHGSAEQQKGRQRVAAVRGRQGALESPDVNVFAVKCR
jgi:hypothetical protein